jgi:hypothetical protein
MKIYAVLDKNYEYNDEYYYQAGNGNVVKVFATPHEADAFKRTEGVKYFRMDPEQYLGEEGYDFIYKQNGRELLKTMSDEEVFAVMEKNGVELFETQPIEVTDDFLRQIGK